MNAALTLPPLIDDLSHRRLGLFARLSGLAVRVRRGKPAAAVRPVLERGETPPASQAGDSGGHVQGGTVPGGLMPAPDSRQPA